MSCCYIDCDLIYAITSSLILSYFSLICWNEKLSTFVIFLACSIVMATIFPFVSKSNKTFSFKSFVSSTAFWLKTKKAYLCH